MSASWRKSGTLVLVELRLAYPYRKGVGVASWEKTIEHNQLCVRFLHNVGWSLSVSMYVYVIKNLVSFVAKCT